MPVMPDGTYKKPSQVRREKRNAKKYKLKFHAPRGINLATSALISGAVGALSTVLVRKYLYPEVKNVVKNTSKK